MRTFFAIIADSSRSLSWRLGKCPSLVYAFVYMAAIPCFALGYYLLPGHFHYAIPDDDPASYGNVQPLLERLSQEYRENFQRITGGTTFKKDDWTFSVANAVFHTNFPIEDKKWIAFDFVFRGKRMLDKTYLTAPIRSVVQISADRFWAVGKEERKYRIVKVDVDLDPPSGIGGDALFPHDPLLMLGGEKIPMGNELLMPVSDSLNDLISNYVGGFWGWRVRRIIHFERMLYLSAITITTCGFGDVVPVSRRARVLVATEAVMGILLMGLFLNAVAYERSLFVHRYNCDDP